MTQLSGKAGEWRRWRLHEDLIYEVGEIDSPRHIVVPAGFVSDGPTIPRFLWVLLPVWGSYGRAGVLHDYLCARIVEGNPHDEAKTRDEADRVFLESMASLGVGMVTRWAMYLGVRLGTWFGVKPTMLAYNRVLLGAQKEAQHDT